MVACSALLLVGCGSVSGLTGLPMPLNKENRLADTVSRSTDTDKVARDLVAALVKLNLSGKRSGFASALAMHYPQNSFEVSLLRELQLAGFRLVDATSSSELPIVSYRVLQLKEEVNPKPALTTHSYRIELQTPEGTYLGRLYRWQHGVLRPSGPMIEQSATGRMLQIVETDPTIFDAA